MKEKLCGIYCIENIINNKKYIGMSRDIKRRWCEHKAELNNSDHDNQYLQRSWNKYGSINFKFYIVELCEEEKLSELECYYIKLYKTLSHENGYNLTVGGENTSIGRLVISLKDGCIFNFVKEAAKRENISPITMTKWCREKRYYMFLDEFNCLSEEEKKYWINFDWKNFIHEKISKAHSRENLSMQTIEKMKRSTHRKNNPRAYSVYCHQLKETFDCVKDASDKYGVCYTSIIQCVNGMLKSAGKHPITGEKLTWEKIK